MSELQDYIADMNGIRLHRRRKLTAFSHVSEGPLLQMLFTVTRPAVRPKNGIAAHHPAAVPGPKIVRRGMVNYRRELYGFGDDAQTIE